MGWKGFDFGDQVNKLKEPERWFGIFCEAVASMLFVMVAANAGDAASPWNWAISFVVISCVFSGSHINSWITFYKAFVGDMCPIQALFFLGAQFLGVYVAHHFGGALGMNQDSLEGVAFEVSNWQDGLQEFIAVSVFLFCYLHANSERYAGDMPKNLFVLFAVGVTFMVNGNTAFTFSRFFQSQAAIGACGPSVLWGVVACILMHVKMVLMGFEKGWFWE